MPEGGLEREFQVRLQHNCPNAKHFRKALKKEDADIVYFNVGSHGEGMPQGVPFRVTATFPCDVCGVTPSQWFEWKARLIFV